MVSLYFHSLTLLRKTALFAFFLLPNATLTQAAEVKLALADGFDFPVGKPDGANYYKARGFWPNAHPGEDWNGNGGGNTDLGDPVYAMGDGIVVASADYRKGWGNCVIIRHVYRSSNGSIQMCDSQYAHLDKRYVTINQKVKRGQKIGTIGTNRGMYLAHLHFEVRKNLRIGMNRSQFDRTFTSYHDPTKFINAHRKCDTSGGLQTVALNTFAPYGQSLSTTQIQTTKSNVSIPVAQNRQESINRVVREVKKSDWRPSSTGGNLSPSTSTQAAGEINLFNRTSSQQVEMDPRIAHIVAEAERKQRESSQKLETNGRNPSPPEERDRFWQKFKPAVVREEPESPKRGIFSRIFKRE